MTAPGERPTPIDPPAESATTPRRVDGLGDTAARRDSALTLPQRVYDRALDCVHCGLCLPACPTYTQTGLEAESPRGRIDLIKALADGRVEPTAEVRLHLDQCLDCRACETACPSGVVYHELIEHARPRLAAHGGKSPAPTGPEIPRDTGRPPALLRAFIRHVFPRRPRLAAAVAPARLLQRLGLLRPLVRSPLMRLAPRWARKMAEMLPPAEPGRAPPIFPPRLVLGRVTPERFGRRPLPAARVVDEAHPEGRPRRVGLFLGCVGYVMQPRLSQRTVDLLELTGCEVVAPESQGCCGAIPHHNHHPADARAFALANLDAFERAEVDVIVQTAAGCGAMLRELVEVFDPDDPADAGLLDRARRFAARIRDVTELLVELDGPRPDAAKPTNRPRPVRERVTYHDACHLAHAQRVTDPPRRVLQWIPGIEVVPLPESLICCGAAGTYNLTQPEMAAQLGGRKIDHVRATGSSVCVTGNIGCAMQLDAEARRAGLPLRVAHPVDLLHEACFGEM